MFYLSNLVSEFPLLFVTVVNFGCSYCNLILQFMDFFGTVSWSYRIGIECESIKFPTFIENAH